MITHPLEEETARVAIEESRSRTLLNQAHARLLEAQAEEIEWMNVELMAEAMKKSGQ